MINEIKLEDKKEKKSNSSTQVSSETCLENKEKTYRAKLNTEEENLNVSKENEGVKVEDQDKKTIEKRTCPFTMTMKFLKDFLKYYGFRTIFSFFQVYVMKSKKSLSFFDLIFSMSNLRTTLFISALPLLYKLMIKFLGESKYGVFASAIIFGFICINIEEKTKLVNFLLLSLMSRVFHGLLLKFNKTLEVELPGSSMELLFFILLSFIILYVSFKYPDFTAITQTIDNYANFGRVEKYEINHLRRITKV